MMHEWSASNRYSTSQSLAGPHQSAKCPHQGPRVQGHGPCENPHTQVHRSYCQILGSMIKAHQFCTFLCARQPGHCLFVIASSAHVTAPHDTTHHTTQ